MRRKETKKGWASVRLYWPSGSVLLLLFSFCLFYLFSISFRIFFHFPVGWSNSLSCIQVECGMIPIEPIRWWNCRTLQFVAQLAHTVTSSLFYLSLSFFLLLLLFLLRHLTHTHTHTFYIYIYILQWSWRAVCSFRLTSPRSLLSFSDAMASTNPFIYIAISLFQNFFHPIQYCDFHSIVDILSTDRRNNLILYKRRKSLYVCGIQLLTLQKIWGGGHTHGL